MDKERKDQYLRIFKKFVTRKATYAYGMSKSGNEFVHGVYDDNGFSVFGTESKNIKEIHLFTKVNKCKIQKLKNDEFFFLVFRYDEKAFAFFRNFLMTKDRTFPFPIDIASLLRLVKATSKNQNKKHVKPIVLNLNTKNGKAYTFFDPKKVKKFLQPLDITEENGVEEMIGSSYFCPTIDILDEPTFYPCLFRRIENKKTNMQIYILLSPFVPEGRYTYEFKVDI